jgi:flagellar hook-associated protein 1 FlgK
VIGDLFSALRTAGSGLSTNQQALSVVAQNIANVNTPGYSRKEVSLQPQVVDGAVGGVEMAAVGRTVDENLLRSLRHETSALAALKVEDAALGRLQTLFGSPGDDASLSHAVARFQAAAESLAVSPDSALAQSAVVRRGEDLAFGLRELSAGVQTLRQEADRRIADAVEEINGLLGQIADLNSRIQRDGYAGRDTTTHEDQRDQALDALAKLIDIRVYRRGDGEAVVFTESGRTLVDGGAVALGHTAAAQMSAGTTYPGGGIDGISIGAPPPGTDITGEIRSGELAGLIRLRDATLPDVQSGLDELAATLRDSVNEVHNRGTAFPGAQTLTGTRTFADPATETITLGGGQDVAIALFDRNGVAAASTTLQSVMAGYGSADWPIDEIAGRLQNWLQANGAAGASVSTAAGGGLGIDLGGSAFSLGLRDQVDSDPALGFADVDIAYSGEPATAFRGFAHFFGLNDFFVDTAAAGDVGVSASINVRADIRRSPAKLAGAAVQWDPSAGPGGAYGLSPGDDGAAQALAATLAAGTGFDAAGGLPAQTTGLADYAAQIVGRAAADKQSLGARATDQQALVETLDHQARSFSGVNLDQELADLMLYEQAYSAAARVISVVQSMFDALERTA